MRSQARHSVLGPRAALAATILCCGWPQDSAAASDIELGRYLANQCLTCHRTASVGGIAIPNIFGAAESHLVAQLKAYRDKKLPNDVMQAQAAGLKDDEVEALAAYFSRTKRP